MSFYYTKEAVEMELNEEMRKYLQYCKCQKELDGKTIRAYQTDLEQFILFLQENGEVVNKETVNLYLIDIHARYKQKTVKRKIASVKAFFGYLEDEEIIELNPMHRIKTKFKEEQVLPKIVPRNVIEQLLKHLYMKNASQSCSDWQKKLILRDIAVIEMLFATGIRISELCQLKSKFFDMEEGVLCIQGKGGKERYLQIGNMDVLNILTEYRKQYRDVIEKHGFFFVNRYGQPLSEQSARRMLHKYARDIKADISITPHMLRHSFATYLMEEEVNIRYIQKMLGHSSITTTQIYTYVATEKERELLRTRHPRNKMQIGNVK